MVSMDEKLMQRISTIYQETGSLRQTAAEVGFAYAKVRKILISLGEYSTPFSEYVYSLRSLGHSVEEIAQKMNTTPRRVSAWLPYEKNIYNMPDKTPEAIRCDSYRQRIDQARKEFVLNKYLNSKERCEIMKKTDMAESKLLENNGNIREEAAIPLRLRLEVEEEWLDENERRILKKYGRSSDGKTFERIVLVPPDITLHSLHYAIQKLFGWQNSHLHDYKLPDEIYSKLTNDTVRGWGNLIGVLFQTVYPGEVWQERYGDDDYSSGSAKTWLRSKYTGPYRYLGMYELYERAVFEFEEFVKDYPNLAVREPFKFQKERKIIKHAPVIDLTLEELNASLILEDGTKDLLERLLVSAVLAPEGEKTAGAEELNQKMITRYYNAYGEVAEPEIKPVTTKLFYHYDYGDGWVVEITRLENCDELIEKDLVSKEELINAQNSVAEKYRPVCIYQDGMFLLDDVGGLGGFIELLQVLFESDDLREKEEMRIWSSGMGWSKRRIESKNIL